MSALISIIASWMQIAAAVFGDAVLAKWVAAARLWWRQLEAVEFKRMADAEYDKVAANWDKLKNDRGPLRPK